MPQYLLSVWDTQGAEPPADLDVIFKAVDDFNADLQKSGAWVFAGGLHPADTATVVRIEGGQTVTTDGPYAETKEQLGGFWIVDVADLDAALAVAARGSEACRNPVEVRPFQDEPPTEG